MVGRGLTTGGSFAAALLSAWWPSAAEAQAVAPTRDELSRIEQLPRTEQSRLNVGGDVERSPCALADPQFASITVTLSEVRFNGLKGATSDEMRRSWADLAGREQPVSVLCDIRDRAATVLREKGYLAAVQVPVQRIENGVVQMEVLYGRVTAVRARGQTGGAEAKLASYLGKLTADPIFDRRRAERYLLLARDLPGYNVQLTLRPASTAPGDLVGEVTVVRRPYAVDATIQNLAARGTGRWGGQVRAQVYGLTGLGDATTLSYYNVLGGWREQRIMQAGHEFRPGGEGLVINGQVTYAWSRPEIGADAGDPALRARTLFATLGLTYPLVRRQSRSWYLSGGLDLLNQRVELIAPLTRDRLRIAFLRTSFEAIDLKRGLPHWRLNGALELRRGLDLFGASSSCRAVNCTDPDVVPLSRLDADPTPMLIRAAGGAELALGRTMSVFVSPRAQLAFDPLPAFEEFTGGNYTIGRGYDAGTISGDSGVGVTGELRGPRLPLGRGPLQLQPFLFGDAAWAWNKRDGAGADRLTSAGGGVRAELGDRLRMELTAAKGLRRAGLTDRKPDARVLLTLTTRLLPWR
ncbi:ShlB/FhaC/HecB family hemolysin secretion/activation protein [Sphingomonas sp. BN140010]|uniref:ShlB/FhaC/HecB family hemolysin secretion/activation protein n=1 Tax=Sphingomonas arvum TaxID=2992113 RepID=A0ABT3JAX2_9SPHN|nr:ShlB/FhaC/HecB family hemolysin secretion/activation protein [Sphingomonas sp. BN140010]MCW3796197.1 ShlB/FhaC/HecB family hemolysin secretion/activation protein [Sphingomonas sp. BN140010]